MLSVDTIKVFFDGLSKIWAVVKTWLPQTSLKINILFFSVCLLCFAIQRRRIRNCQRTERRWTRNGLLGTGNSRNGLLGTGNSLLGRRAISTYLHLCYIYLPLPHLND
jgi:hypothetical protein